MPRKPERSSQVQIEGHKPVAGNDPAVATIFFVSLFAVGLKAP